MSYPNLTVVVSSQTPLKIDQFNDSEVPAPVKKLTPAEKKIWTYVCGSLKNHGLIHKTDGLMLHVICTTFVQWVIAEEYVQKLIDEHGHFMVKTPNGYVQPHQTYYVARTLKKELLNWLPEACLTIPSFRKEKNLTNQPQQPDLFGQDGLRDFVGSKPRLVGG